MTNSSSKTSDNKNSESAEAAVSFNVMSVKSILEGVSKVLAPSTLIVSLLVYYGWVRTEALYTTLGINQSLLQLSNQDYILRSIRVMFEPLRWFLLVALACIWTHFVLSRYIDNRQRLIWGWAIFAIIIGLLLAAGLTMVSFSLITLEWLIWLLSLIAAGYGLYLLERVKLKHQDMGWTKHLPSNLLRLSYWLLLILLILSTFVSVGEYAEIIGRRDVARLVEVSPQVVVYSREPLGLSGNTVQVVETNAHIYTHRYQGLKFLIHADDKYFLIPKSWSIQAPRLIVLPDSDMIRLEFAPSHVKQ